MVGKRTGSAPRSRSASAMLPACSFARVTRTRFPERPVERPAAVFWPSPIVLMPLSHAVAMSFPTIRPRRLRTSPAMRALVRETNLAPRDFVWPLFFSASVTEPQPIGTMPGVFQLPVMKAADCARQAVRAGLGGVLLFGLPKTKDARGSSGVDPAGP